MANTKKTTDAVEKEVDTAVNTNTEEKAEVKAETVQETPKKETTAEVIGTFDKVVDSVSNVDTAKAPSSREAKLTNEEEIAVRSVTFGGLTWVSPRTNAHYRWNEIGAIEYIPFGELITMNNTARAFLFDPLVYIQDGRVVEYFRLNATYEKITCVDKLEEMFNKGDLDEIGVALRSLVNTNMRDIAISKIRTLRQESKLTNIDVIRLIEKILCFDMD